MVNFRIHIFYHNKKNQSYTNIHTTPQYGHIYPNLREKYFKIRKRQGLMFSFLL